MSTLSDQGVCNGDLEVLNSTTFIPPEAMANGSRTAGLAEMWCVQYKSQLRYRYFGLPELQGRLAWRNTSGLFGDARARSIGATVQSLVVSGKRQGSAASTAPELWLHRSSSQQADVVRTASVAWQDALVACPFFTEDGLGGVSTGYGNSKLLSVARAQSWAYGSSAMVQKVRIELSGNLQVPLNSTTLLGAFILQKGAQFGGGGHVQITAAKTSWHEHNVTCATVASSCVLAACSGLSAAALNNSAGGNPVNATRRSIMRHATDGWAVADVTELAQCQVRQLELFSGGALPEAFELGFLWQPVEPSEDVQFSREHYPMRAAGDVDGDADRAVNASAGRTDWYTSESADPPRLVLYWAA